MLLNYNEYLSKNYQLGYWVQNNLTEQPTHFVKTEDLYNSYRKTFKAYDNKILTLNGFSKAINKTMKMFSLNFTKKRLKQTRGSLLLSSNSKLLTSPLVMSL